MSNPPALPQESFGHCTTCGTFTLLGNNLCRPCSDGLGPGGYQRARTAKRDADIRADIAALMAKHGLNKNTLRRIVARL